MKPARRVTAGDVAGLLSFAGLELEEIGHGLPHDVVVVVIGTVIGLWLRVVRYRWILARQERQLDGIRDDLDEARKRINGWWN